MHLIEFPLLPSACISLLTLGFFSGTKSQQEIAVIRGASELEILASDSQTGKLSSLIRRSLFGTVRSIQPVRPLGSSKDYIVIGSDSGRVSILEYVPETRSLEILALETFGRSGCRRAVPGQFLSVDPKGRAFLLCAIEKMKFAYILNRDATSTLSISSPLDCHKSHTMVHFVVALDVGFENPVFFALESFLQAPGQDALSEAEQMLLVHYELDLGLNHMVRKYQRPVDPTTHLLLALPNSSSASSGPDGPGGVLGFAINSVTWYSEDYKVDPFSLSLPMDNLLVCASFLHKTKSSFFVLFQLESGDLFKLTLEHHGDTVTRLEVRYFDSIKLSRSMCILRAGFLIVASEQRSNATYQIVGLAEDEEQKWDTENNSKNTVVPRAELKNLSLLEEENSLLPITDSKVPFYFALPHVGASYSRRRFPTNSDRRWDRPRCLPCCAKTWSGGV